MAVFRGAGADGDRRRHGPRGAVRMAPAPGRHHAVALVTAVEGRPRMRIDIWSDIVCPWCYVGKRRFETALALFGAGGDVEIVHHSFQLNPTAPRHETAERRDMLRQKYRLTPGQVEDMDARMTATAAA